ncbi:hypothetical protein GCM10023214_44180 [Amycolatopsis dongchuanensis]|uniref:Uncharacterized protein n=1 Tax=Amycolatopsis dongchuanensis TaxID=1070866 RepID=A0ABP9QVV1_9PSEU
MRTARFQCLAWISAAHAPPCRYRACFPEGVSGASVNTGQSRNVLRVMVTLFSGTQDRHGAGEQPAPQARAHFAAASA